MKSILSFFSRTPTIPFEEDILPLIQSGNTEELKQIFETKSIDPTLLTKVKTNQQGLTLMSFAAYHNKTEVIKYLHMIGCDVNQSGKNGDNPLTRACYYKRYDSIKVLVELGANINAKFDEYPLIQSLYRKSEELLEFILKCGADTSILYKEEYKELMEELPRNIKLVINRHEAFKRRVPMLMLLKNKKLGKFQKLPNFILKEVVLFM